MSKFAFEFQSNFYIWGILTQYQSHKNKPESFVPFFLAEKQDVDKYTLQCYSFYDKSTWQILMFIKKEIVYDKRRDS